MPKQDESKKKTVSSKKTSSTSSSKKVKKVNEKTELKVKEKKPIEVENWDNEFDNDDDNEAQNDYDKCPPNLDQIPYNDEEEKPTLTKRGLEMLTSELKELKSIKRQEVAERIRQARALGDISENSEYEEAKRDQAMFETRIIELERLLKSAIIVDETAGAETCVRVGTEIQVENLASKEKDSYRIVGTLEADPLKNLISNSSPFGRAMIGRQTGEVVKVLTPHGYVKYRILEIKKGS
jgi:transcription elongation factor GreA